jgi:heme-degrading monooxygenase HmoA
MGLTAHPDYVLMGLQAQKGGRMFSVMFEVNPRGDQLDAYLGYAKPLRPELENIDGFIDNVRYSSLRREGWILSLSSWRDEKALVRWRTTASHHDVQQKGRDGVLLDYHLRVGQITADNELPVGNILREQRLDETETGKGSAVTLLSAHATDDERCDAAGVIARLGFQTDAAGLLTWDVYRGVQDPTEVIVMAVWRDQGAAQASLAIAQPAAGARSRVVRVIRDYGMFDRVEAPQFYPAAQRSATVGLSASA